MIFFVLMSLLRYRHTNESLAAIVEGLDVQPSDAVLAVSASGDQPFAILEKAAKVVAVDEDIVQLNYTKIKAKILEIGNYYKFLYFAEPGDEMERVQLAQAVRYFRIDGRLRRIRLKLPNLDTRLGDISSIEYGEKFDKMYLSDVPIADLGWRQHHFEVLCTALIQGGLMYVAGNAAIEDVRQNVLRIPRLIMPKCMVLDERLTAVARRHETESEIMRWIPEIYRK